MGIRGVGGRVFILKTKGKISRDTVPLSHHSILSEETITNKKKVVFVDLLMFGNITYISV